MQKSIIILQRKKEGKPIREIKKTNDLMVKTFEKKPPQSNLTSNPKPKTQNPKPKTQNPKPKTQNPKP